MMQSRKMETPILTKAPLSKAPLSKEWPKAVIMDLDGTLIDSAPDIANALNKALIDAEIEPFTLEEVRFMIGGGVPKLVERAFNARELPLEGPKEAQRLEEVISGVMDYYVAAPAIETTIYEGVEFVLKTLCEQGVKVGLCTNKPQNITELALEALNMTAYFDAIVGGTSDTPRKPDPLTLNMCVDQLGLTAEDCLLVGDSGADKGAADAANMAVFLVEYGYYKNPVSELKPDATLPTMTDLLTHLFPELELSEGARA